MLKVYQMSVSQVGVVGEDTHWTAVFCDALQECSRVAVAQHWWVDRY